MAVEILIVKEDLKSIVPGYEYLGSIEPNNDFYKLRDLAKQLKLTLIPTIDEVGLTIINELQRLPLAQEIQKLRSNPQVNQKILDDLQEALDAVNQTSHIYIKLIGD